MKSDRTHFLKPFLQHRLTKGSVKCLVLLLFCTGVSTGFSDDLSEPVRLSHKSHCQKLDIKDPLYQNVRRTAEYIRGGDLETVEQVLRQGLPINAYYENRFHMEGNIFHTPFSLLDTAVMFKKHDILDMLLKHGANPEGCGTENLDSLYVAISNKDFQSLDKLIEAGANPNALIGPKQLQQTALHYLVSNPKGCANEPVSREILGSMQKLITHGANIDALNAVGESPLIQSVKNCQYNKTYPLTTLLLITHAADPFIYSSQGINIIHKMVSHGTLSRHHDLWRLLSHYVWSGGHKMMQTAREYPDLQEKLKAIQEEMIRPQGFFSWLMSLKSGTLHDFLPAVLDIFGDERVFSHDRKQVKSLVTCRDYSCFTPLHFAGHTLLTPEALGWLEWLGTDFSETSYEGNTVLHYAIKNNQFENLDILRPYRVKPELRNSDGMNSFDMAMTYTPDENKHAVFNSLCNMQQEDDTPEECLAFFDLFNVSCTQSMAAENTTRSANSRQENHYLSSFAMNSCLGNSHYPLSSQQKLEVLSEPLDTTYNRINNRINTHDKTWILPQHVRRYDMLDYPELKNYLIKQYPGQSDHLKHKINENYFSLMFDLSGLVEPYYDYSRTETLIATDSRPSALMSATFNRMNAKAIWASPSELTLNELQSFAQLKHYLTYSNSPEKEYTQTYLIQRNEPALFMYTLTMGMKPEHKSPCSLPESMSYLCQDPVAAIQYSNNGKDFLNTLPLYGFYDFSLIRHDEQRRDLSLYLAVHNKNAYMVELLLSKGANPNAYIPEEHYEHARAFLLSEVADSFKIPSCGLLADALRIEQNKGIAPMSRLLLLYGASVDPVIPHGCSLLPNNEQSLPLSWISRIQDRELATTLNYFDPANIRYRAESNAFMTDDTLVENTLADNTLTDNTQTVEWYSDYQTSVNVLSTAAKVHPVILNNNAYSPLCTCAGLQHLSLPYGPLKENEKPAEYAPYCQVKIKELPDSVQMSICSPAVFQ